MYQICNDRQAKLPLFKDIIGDVLIELAEQDPRVMVFDADLANASGLSRFGKRFPDRLFDCGIQEANMVGMAASASDAGASRLPTPLRRLPRASASTKCFWRPATQTWISS